MSRSFYHQSIVAHFFGEDYHRHPVLSCGHMSDIQASLSDPNRNVLAFIVSVRQLLENANTNKELDITSALRDLTDTRNYPVGSKTNCFTELWLERSIDTTLPNFKDKLQRQLQVLMQVCGTNLISPLVQMVH